MIQRLRSLIDLRQVEAVLIGLFFIQALRYLIGTLYARIASASLYPSLDTSLIDPTLPGLVEPATASSEISFLVYMLALPLIALILGRFRFMLFIAAVIAAGGRYLMAADVGLSMPMNASLVIGGGLLYMALMVRHRARILPVMMVMAISIDQLFRAAGDTLDPSWESDYLTIQTVLSIAAVVIAGITAIPTRSGDDDNQSAVSPDRGLMTVWSGIGLGGLLFLQLSLLALPNVVARRADTDYALMVPLVMAATLLPLIPWVRGQARTLIGLFDSSVRGWVWMLLLMLMVVFGTRLNGIVAGVALVLAQFTASMLWWWLVRPQAAKERNFTGIWLVLGMLIFALLVVFDTFTYEYAFVRDFSPEFDFLNPIIPPLLRGFRGLGLAVILLGTFFTALPMTQMQRRIPWTGGKLLASVLTGLLVVGMATGASYLARPPVVTGVVEPETVRFGSYNIHAGFNEFYHYDMEAIALTIQRSGAAVVLLQEVEAGRMSSFGVDQPLWLARRLGMKVSFFPTNESLQGLAALSRIDIVFDDGVLLDSVGSQTGMQRVQILPDTGVITVYNTLLDPLVDTGGEVSEIEDSQTHQLDQIFGVINAHHQPDGRLGRTVIGGTFNNIPDSDLIQRMRDNGFQDHFAGQPIELAATFWRTGARARLDYLWTFNIGSFQPLGRIVVDSNASDHRMLVVEMQLR